MAIDLSRVRIAVGSTTVYTDEDGIPPNDITDINAIYASETPKFETPQSAKVEAEASKVAEVSAQRTQSESIPTESMADTDRMASSWDPRLRRLDYFLYNGEELNSEDAIRVPFASRTLATLFGETVYTLEKAAVMQMIKMGTLPKGSDAYKRLAGSVGDAQPSEISESSEGNGETTRRGAGDGALLKGSDKVIMSSLKDYENDPYSYGVQSMMNPYSMTRLMGGISDVSPTSVQNYMYDIRDSRRFYDLSTEGGDVLSVQNPTVTNIIEWGNKDRWGRTPYSFQDFVFCKHFGIIPNNRLITLRRYHAPTYDNLNFENMWGDIETPKKGKDGMNKPEGSTYNHPDKTTPNGTFAPVCTVVSYFGGDSGNTLSSLLNFTSGVEWTDVASEIHQISGNEGESPQSVIDRMFDGDNGFGATSHPTVNNLLTGMSSVSSRIMSFGKFALGCNGTFGSSQKTVDHLNETLEDPYAKGPYENRIIGPLNRIQSVKKRKEGIKFDQKFSVKCSYVTKAIGGVNPKAAMLDILGNCMSMVSPQAVFWGGGHQYMIKPTVYPFHDGGWRDSFMKAIYDGKVLGKDGALSIIGSGIRKVAADENGDISMDAITSSLGDGLGEIMGAISAGLSAMASNISIGGLSDFLSSASSFMGGAGGAVGGADSVAAGASKLSGLIKNVDHMWHDKLLQQTTFPKITGMGALLIGEPVGEWHLTVGNPLNPLLVCGNLICSDMKVEFDDELGPDDFPIGFSVTYTLEHGMQRDRNGIQSMLNKGMGKYYVLPDYSSLSSNMETHVDNYTGGTGNRTNIEWLSPSRFAQVASVDGVKTSGYKVRKIDAGHGIDTAKNPNTQIITKFTPPNTLANMTLGDIRNMKSYVTEANMPIVRSLAITRKYNG